MVSNASGDDIRKNVQVRNGCVGIYLLVLVECTKFCTRKSSCKHFVYVEFPLKTPSK